MINAAGTSPLHHVPRLPLHVGAHVAPSGGSALLAIHATAATSSVVIPLVDSLNEDVALVGVLPNHVAATIELADSGRQSDEETRVQLGHRSHQLLEPGRINDEGVELGFRHN